MSCMISGGYAAFGIGLSAFIADISSPDQRAFRMGMIHLAQSLGRPIAAGNDMGYFNEAFKGKKVTRFIPLQGEAGYEIVIQQTK